MAPGPKRKHVGDASKPKTKRLEQPMNLHHEAYPLQNLGKDELLAAYERTYRGVASGWQYGRYACETGAFCWEHKAGPNIAEPSDASTFLTLKVPQLVSLNLPDILLLYSNTAIDTKGAHIGPQEDQVLDQKLSTSEVEKIDLSVLQTSQTAPLSKLSIGASNFECEVAPTEYQPKYPKLPAPDGSRPEWPRLLRGTNNRQKRRTEAAVTVGSPAPSLLSHRTWDNTPISSNPRTPNSLHQHQDQFHGDPRPLQSALNAMAPVRDDENVESALKDTINILYQMQSRVHGFAPETQKLLIDNIHELAGSLSQLQTLTSKQDSPNNPIHDARIAPEFIDYVDDSRNPDIYTRDFVELVQRGNSVLNGKQKAFRDFSKVFAQALKDGIEGIDDEIDQVMKNADLQAEDEQTHRNQKNGVSGS